MIVVGVDPGQLGGFAAVDASSMDLIDTLAMPLMQVRKKVTIDAHAAGLWFERVEADVGVLELVTAMPRQGVSSSFQFGRMFGAAEAIVLNWTLKQDYAIPSVWKAKMGLSSDKNASRALATRLFGQEAAKHWTRVKDDGLAEAALVAFYYIRHVMGRN